MTKLEKARAVINEVDGQIAQCFEKRMHAAEDVVAHKMEHHLPIFDGVRENEVIERNLAKIEDEKLKPYYRDMLIQLMRISKEYQNAILHQGIYGYQGAHGAFGHIATGRLFPSGQQKNYAKFEDVIKGVLNHEIEKGVLPFENSTTGEIGEVMDLLYRYDVKISAFYDLKVEHNLMGIKGAQLSDIKRVYSKLQAIEQCEDVLRPFDFELIPYTNTALAAKLVAESSDKSIGAIAAKESAAEYGLDILMENINSAHDNVTRFIVIENTLPKHSNLVMAIFTVNHESGALAKIMHIVAEYNLNMTSIRSRACKDKSWQYYFYMEVEGDIADKNMTECFEKCREHCEEFKVIGCIEEAE
ncbi:MAG: chorismate mutase [Oscillospiraceae bacterium]|nr:chorismate mutase [Oscillospiraceae bacterium]